MVPLADLRVSYEAMRPLLGDLLVMVRSRVAEAAADLAIGDPRIDGRTKTLSSFLLKALNREREGRPWVDPLVEATDKVGVRVDVVYLDDVYRLVDHLKVSHHFEILKVDDKLDTVLGEDVVGYRGVHLDVLPQNRPEGLAPEHSSVEIQIRTNAQAAWAMAAHDILYKGPVELDRDQKRRINRLTALMELFDETIQGARQEIMNSDSYPIGRLVAALERLWIRFHISSFNASLSRDLVTALVGGGLEYADASAMIDDVEQFIEAHTEKLATIFEDNSSMAILLSQPESILVFYQLDTDPFMAQQRWNKADLPPHLLDEMADLWGVPLPTPG